MKKILSVLICIAMLLMACAFAEGGELSISNVQVSVSDGTVLDLSGIDLRLAAAADEAGGGVRLAVGANGEEVLSAVASVDEEKVALKLDGMSSAYTVSMADIMTMLMEDPDFQELMQLISALDFTEQDLIELIAIVETFMANMDASISETGTEEIDGVTYQSYAINFGEEGYEALFRGIVELLDQHPALMALLLEGSGYETLGQAYDALGMKMYAEGTMLTSESDAEIDLTAYSSVNGEEAAAVNAYGFMSYGVDEEVGLEGVDMTMLMSEVAGEEYISIFEVNGSVFTDTATGAFAGFDGYFIVPIDEENWDGVVLGVYGPQLTGTGLWQLSVSDWNGSFTYDVSFGEVDGLEGVYGIMAADGAEINYYSELQDGVGEFGVSVVAADGTGFEVLTDLALSETDGAWLNVDTANAVNLLTLTEEQTSTAGMELMVILMNVVSELAAANETVAALAGSLMG